MSKCRFCGCETDDSMDCCTGCMKPIPIGPGITLDEFIARLLVENTILKAKLTNSQRDAERLDWLDTLPDSTEFKPNLFGSDIRQAIDRAMNTPLTKETL